MTRLPGLPAACAAVLVLGLAASADAQTCGGDTLVNAGTITPNGTTQTVSGSVTATQGAYYSFTVSATGGYLFSLCAARGGSANYDSTLCLLDASFAQLVYNDDFCGAASQISRTLSPGTYYIGVASWSSSSGNYTLAYSVDATPPVAGTVNDGPGADVEWQTSVGSITANWSGFSDPESGISLYEMAIGTSPGAANVRAFTWFGTATSGTINFLSLSGGVTYYVTIRATNGVGGQTTASSDGVSVFAMTGAVAFPDATEGQAYTGASAATFGTGPYTWVRELGDLPPGLTLASDGTMSGTPTATGGFLFGCLVTDSLAATRRFSCAVKVLPAGGGMIVASGNTTVVTPLPSTSTFATYTQALSATGGQVPRIWTITEGAPPPGLLLDALTGTFSNWASRPGTFSFTVAATDSDDPSRTAQARLTLQVTGTPSSLFISTPATLPAAYSSAPYAVVLAAGGGTGEYAWSLTSGSLPPGLALDPSGVLSGTPTTTGTFPFSLTVTDEASATATLSASLTITAGQGPLEVSPTTLPHAVQGLLYPMGFSATGGTPGYVWSISSGVLPSGLTLDPVTGAFSGTPSSSGLFRFVVRVVDSGATPSSAALVVRLQVLRTSSSGYVIATASPLSPGENGVPYRTAMGVLGGANPHAWEVWTGSLPPGLLLNANTGEISGTPGSPGTFSFALRASSNGGLVSSTRLYSMTIAGVLPSGGGGGSGGCGMLGWEAPLVLALAALVRRKR